MESHNILSCLKCNEKLTEVYMLPCMHNFCIKCTNLMKNGAKTTCLICSNSCHQDEVKRNTFLEKICLLDSQNKKSEIEMIICELCDSTELENLADKYCVDCSQYICLKCSARHVKLNICKDHKIIDKNNVKNLAVKLSDPSCDKHKTKITIYCKTCDSIICPTCFIIDHINHDKSDNLNEVFANSISNIKGNIIEIDNIIKKQNELFKENQVQESNLLKECDNVQHEIESYAKELKDQIDNLTKANVDKVAAIKNNFIKSVQTSLKEINEYITSLTNLKSYFQELINKGSNVDVFNSRKELNKNTWNKTKKANIIPKFNLSFQKPSIDTLILNEISGSLKFDEIKTTAENILECKCNNNNVDPIVSKAESILLTENQPSYESAFVHSPMMQNLLKILHRDKNETELEPIKKRTSRLNKVGNDKRNLLGVKDKVGDDKSLIINKNFYNPFQR